MTPSESGLVKALIRQALGLTLIPENLANDRISHDPSADDIAEALLRYAQLSPEHAERLSEPYACFSLGGFLTAGATLYSLLSLSGVSRQVQDRPIRVLHVGANDLDCMDTEPSCAAFRLLFPGAPLVEHAFVGPEAEIPDPDFPDQHSAFFPDLAVPPNRRGYYTGTLGAVFESSPKLRDEVLSGGFDALFFSSPGFVARDGSSCLDCPAVSEIMTDQPNLLIIGSSYKPADFALDKVFLESRFRAVESAHLSGMSRMGDECRGEVLWVTKPYIAGDLRPYPGDCLPVSSMALGAAIGLLEEASEHEVWRNTTLDTATLSPGEFVGWHPNRLRITPSITFDIDEVGFIIGEGDAETFLSMGDTIPSATLEMLKMGDYWQRLDFSCDHIKDLCAFEAQLPPFDESALWGSIKASFGAARPRLSACPGPSPGDQY